MSDAASRIGGEITPVNFPTLLVRAASRAPRGLLSVRSGDVERRIHLREGRVLFAGSNDPSEYLAERAVVAGLLTRDQVREALESITSGRRIGSALVKLGYLSEEKLVELLLDQVRAIVASCFGLLSGHWTLTVGELPGAESIVLDEPVAATVAREISRVRTLERLRAAVGEPSTRYLPVRGWKERLAARDLGREGTVAELAEVIADAPGITIRNIVVSLPRSETQILQALWILRAIEVVGTKGGSEAPPPPPPKKMAAARAFADSLAVPRDEPAAPAPPAAVPEPPPPGPSTPDAASPAGDEPLAPHHVDLPEDDEAAIEVQVEGPPAAEPPAPEPALDVEEIEVDVDGEEGAGEEPEIGEAPIPTVEFETPTAHPVAEEDDAEPAPAAAAPTLDLARPLGSRRTFAPGELEAIEIDLSVVDSTVATAEEAAAGAGFSDFADFDPEREMDFGGLFERDDETTPVAAGTAPDGDDPSVRLERALAEAEEEVDLVLALGMERAATSGSLEEGGFAALLRDLSRQRATGTIICKRLDEEKTVTLDRGRPIFATTNVPGERLTERLVSEGILSASDLVRLGEFWPAARRVGGVLLALRLVDADQLRSAIRRQVAEIISSIYAWPDGGYYFLERDHHPAEEVISDLSLPEIALRGVQKIGEPSRLLAWLGGDTRRLRVTEDPASLLQGIPLPADQRDYVSRLGPGGKVADLVHLGPVPPRSALILLSMLVAAGILEATGRERITVPGLPNPERFLGTPEGDTRHGSGRDAAAAELAARWDEISGQGDFAVLGIEPGSAESEVLAAFESTAPTWHPDRFRHYADAAILRLAGRVFDRHVLAFYRIMNPTPHRPSAADAELRRAMLGDDSTIDRGFGAIRTRVLSPAAAPPAPLPPAEPAVGLRTAVVLDDDPVSSGALAEALVALGFAPEVAPGRVALRRALTTPGRKLAAAVVDVDLLMGLDAANLDLLATACRDAGAPCIGVFSRDSETRDQLFFTKFGIQNLVEKSASPEELRATFETFFGRAHPS